MKLFNHYVTSSLVAFALILSAGADSGSGSAGPPSGPAPYSYLGTSALTMAIGTENGTLMIAGLSARGMFNALPASSGAVVNGNGGSVENRRGASYNCTETITSVPAISTTYQCTLDVNVHTGTVN